AILPKLFSAAFLIYRLWQYCHNRFFCPSSSDLPLLTFSSLTASVNIDGTAFSRQSARSFDAQV
ncbi:hypothetical protein, partial [Mesorhizobium japonicum]|uniref:hypothetical protein n=1 Tax=Mesorhizobium japonicum TaxID=2066070 RepID=UPI003B593A4C